MESVQVLELVVYFKTTVWTERCGGRPKDLVERHCEFIGLMWPEKCYKRGGRTWY